MKIRNNKFGKFFPPVQIFMGYVFIACGILFVSTSLLTLLFLIPGTFMGFTYSGTIIDTDNHRVKPYIVLFGIINTGKWIDISQFTRFNIIKASKKYTTYSRGSVRFDMVSSDIELLLINKNGTKKVVLNKYSNFEDAQREKDELSTIIFPEKV
jgi:hypothetical protein